MTDLRTVPLLVFGPYNEDGLAGLREVFDVRQLERRDIALLPEGERPVIRALALGGHLPNEAMDLLPNLEIIGHFGVGYDGVDAAHAASRGIAVTNTPDVLTDEVADTALALVLMTVRDLVRAENHARSGEWERSGPFPLTPLSLRGRRLGIMGLGRIGLAIAQRAESFGLAIEYHNRTRRSDVDYGYHASLRELAEAVDILLVAAPGGAGTERAVNAEVLRALGPKGVFINIGRGSTVDEPALIEALQNGTIAAAGLDVFADEPRIPDPLRALQNVVLLPHVASASRDTRIAMGNLVTENLTRWFLGETLASPVPESENAGLVRRSDRAR
ncbi:2-hydroxyacid dehydrogenase [Aureimonas jatrophae]|uniref:Lactate dehydrogenase n=1 Tax=Aureimonas jatrophae TaxID=1166073 RepID=A0A1H0J5Z8_9HYPH|nr:2-hydroxyacid dehydrogenase [Aureimonas jatrophae]MBB3951576.1 lactate dehydrogenase-like 2-hydroxyacid dehydrogenase [Aureimonas jatrophae]SDO39176.1 Lactate dehydrogenase [Aureimonas jatrophae]